MKDGMIVIKNELQAEQVRRTSYRGEEHLVVPVVIIREGVHNGSMGPLFYPADEIQKFAVAWDGRPVTLRHPELNGEPCSANVAEVAELVQIGDLRNTRFTDDPEARLVSEMWLHVARTKQIAPEVLNIINRGDMIEVSTGLFSENQPRTGTWNGEDYAGVATNHRPDHLAVLPGEVGACSVADGCGGPRTNSQCKKILRNKVENKVQNYDIHIQTNELTLDDRLSAIQTFADSLDTHDTEGGFILINWTEAVFDDRFIVRQENRRDGTKRLLQYEYNVGDDDKLQINEEEVIEVTEKREFVPVSNSEGNAESNINKKEDENMVTKEEKITAIINSDKLKFDEPDRIVLSAMSDEQVDSIHVLVADTEDGAGGEATAAATKTLAGNEGSSDCGCSKKAPVAGDGEAAATQNAGEEEGEEETVDGFIGKAPEGIRDMLRNSVTLHEQEKTVLIGNIMGAEGNTFTKEQLEGKGTDELKAIVNLLKPKGSFAGANPAETLANLSAGGEAPISNEEAYSMPDLYPAETAK